MGMWDAFEGEQHDTPDAEEPMDSEGADEQPEGDEPLDSEGDEGATEGADQETEGVKTAEGVKPSKAEGTATEFDLDGVKFGNLTAEQVAALKRGVALNKDYTAKTQKLASERKALDATYQELQSNPLKLREYFSPEHLMYALGFDPRQRAAAAPTGATAPGGQDRFEKFEPEAAALLREYDSGIQEARREIQGLKSKLGEFDGRFKQTDDAKAQADIESEVGEALTHYPILNNEKSRAYNRQLILMKIAANPERSALEIADEISKIAAVTGTSTPPVSTNRTRVVGPGTSVPMGPKTPKSFDDAEQASHARFGTTFVR